MCVLMCYLPARVCADVLPPARVGANVLASGTCVCRCVILQYVCVLMCYPLARVCADVLPLARVCANVLAFSMFVC